MARVRNLSPDEAKLWRKVAKTTKAYKELPAVAAVSASPLNAIVPAKPTVIKPDAPELPHLALKRAKALRQNKSAPPVKVSTGPNRITPLADAGGHKKVRRGKLEIDARIDLHGMRQIEAQTALMIIIARTRAAHGRCLLVVTGKGQPVDPGEDYITPQAGVIRRRLPDWLAGHGIREHVSGYAQAHPKDGGAGAFYVLLKAKAKI
jgi:DNA-nicking Smr family endonuclease